MSKLIDEIEKREDLNKKQKLFITMFPGIGFGFVPPNFDKLRERLDCDLCLEMCEKVKQVLEIKMPKGLRYKLPWVRKAWQREADVKIEQIVAELKALANRDEEHWKAPEEREVSKEFVSCYLQRDGWEHVSGLL